MYSRDLALHIFGWLLVVYVDFDSVEDGSRACKNWVINRSVSKQRMMFGLDTRGKFFTMRTISHCPNLAREVVDSPTLDTFAGQGAEPSCLHHAFAKNGGTR